MSSNSKRSHWARRAWLAAIVLGALLAYGLWGCADKRAHQPAEQRAAGMPPRAEGMVADQVETDAPAGKALAGASSAVASASAAALPQAEAAASRQEIIYTGEMTIELDDVARSVERVSRMARAAGGWVSATTHASSGEGVAETRLTLRIPASRFSAVHDSLALLGDLVYEATQSQDVGREFVDLEARLANSKREEEVIAALYKREGKIGDVLQVERELARVRGDIEQSEGQLRFLRDQVAFSTLTIRLMAKRPVLERKVAGWSLGYHVLRAWRVLVGIARVLTYGVIYGAIVLGPLALLAWAAMRIVVARRRE